MSDGVPELVAAALARAEAAGFTMSCEPTVGRLLAVLAAQVPRPGRILELGTGTGVGAAWIVSGLRRRQDVTVVTVEADPCRVSVAREGSWPGFVRFLNRDAVDALRAGDQYQLVFADAPGGKWTALEQTIEAVAVGGFLVVDDMAARPSWDADDMRNQAAVRDALFAHPALLSVELEHGSGVILSAKVPVI
jgi:predicted O-methyltransferase YrrM